MSQKRILFICQYFYPEVFRGNDIAFHWAQQGHDVHVIAGIPNYPEGRFYKGYGILKKRKETLNGVHVTHLPIIPRGRGKISLMLNYFSYFIVAWVYVLFHSLFHKYDFVFCQQLSPVMMSAPAILYKKVRRVPLYTWVLDLWPESLSAAGGINNKHILSIFKYFVGKEYRYSDKILTSSKSFDVSILEYGNYSNKIVYFPQWSDGNTQEIADMTFHLPNIPSGFVVMFAGAVGEAHGMECNMHAALKTREHKDIKWVIVGDGRKLDWVRQFVKDYSLEETVFTLGRYPSSTMPKFFNKADVLLVSLTDSPLFNMYAPAKISSYMAAARPIVACLNGEGAEVVNAAGCGWTVPAGDANGLANLVIELSQMEKSELDMIGQTGKIFYDDHFDKSKCLQKLDEIVGINPQVGA